MNSRRLSAYTELTKPRILTLVLVTTTLGYCLGGKGVHSILELLILLLGAAFVCAGSSTLNHYLERDTDGKMTRTRNRPLPLGIICPSSALMFGIVCILSGVVLLWAQINLLTAFLSLMTAFLYVLVYTPMKKISWLNTTIGAIPGAIPPLGGWAAATGQLTLEAWALFLIMFFWQHPHFFAIAWIFKDDYRKGGLKMLPAIETDGRSTFKQILIFSILLVPVSLMPTVLGTSGKIYFWGALIASCGLLFISKTASDSKSQHDARKLLKASVIYLPALFFLIIVDILL